MVHLAKLVGVPGPISRDSPPKSPQTSAKFDAHGEERRPPPEIDQISVEAAKRNSPIFGLHAADVN
jgi:hypothetical protein